MSGGRGAGRPAGVRRARFAGLGLAAALALSACGGESVAVRPDPRTAPLPGRTDGYTVPAPPSYQAPSQGYGGQYVPNVQPRGNTVEGAAFANWVLSTDPQHKYIVDAFVRDDRVLGVIVSPNMTKSQVQQAMGSLLNGMQRTFPNRSLEVIAYYTSGDELARMTYDSRARQTQTTWRR